jgi:hypothetical protein
MTKFHTLPVDTVIDTIAMLTPMAFTSRAGAARDAPAAAASRVARRRRRNGPRAVRSPAVPAGGSTDVLARALAERLSAAFPGRGSWWRTGPAGGRGRTQAAAAAAPDGYTLALGNNQTHAANAAMVRGLPYRPVEDFAAIGRWRRSTTRWWCRPARPPGHWRSWRGGDGTAGR